MASISATNIPTLLAPLHCHSFVIPSEQRLDSIFETEELLSGIQRSCLKTSGCDQPRQGVAIQEEVCMKVDIHLTEEPSSPTRFNRTGAMTALAAVLTLGFAVGPVAPALAQEKPNIIFIMGDDIGWSNIGVYNQGIMAGRTPNLDRLASEGMRFTDYYAEASCTAGRANFITGELPIRTGLTTVGQAGAPLGMPAQAPTIATVLKSMGYATGQFGKNHLGDLNQFLPCVHGFDEFFGYLYHLDAMSDPYWYSFPTDEKYYNTYGPRSLVHCWATDSDDSTVMPRWG